MYILNNSHVIIVSECGTLLRADSGSSFYSTIDSSSSPLCVFFTLGISHGSTFQVSDLVGLCLMVSADYKPNPNFTLT